MKAMIWGDPLRKWRRLRRNLFYRRVPVRVGIMATHVWVPRLRRYEASEYVYSGQVRREAGGEWEKFELKAHQERDARGRLVGLSHDGPVPIPSSSRPFWIDDQSIVRENR